MADNNIPQLDVPQFGALIKQKYPGAYDHIDNGVLVSKFIEKYPVYKSYLAPAQPAESPKPDRSVWETANTASADLAFGAGTTKKALLGSDFEQMRNNAELGRLAQVAKTGVDPGTSLTEYGLGAAERAEHVTESLTSPLSLALFGIGGGARATQAAYVARATDAAAAARTAELASGTKAATGATADFLSASRSAESAHAAARTAQFIHKAADVGFMAQGGVNESELALKAYREKNPALLASEQSLTNLAMVAGGGGGALEKPISMHGLQTRATPEAPKPIETPSATLARPIEKVPELIRAETALSTEATQPTQVTKTNQPLSTSAQATPPTGEAASAIRAGQSVQVPASENPVAGEATRQASEAAKTAAEALDNGTIYQVYAKQKYGERVDPKLAQQVARQTGARDNSELGIWLDEHMNETAPIEQARRGPGAQNDPKLGWENFRLKSADVVRQKLMGTSTGEQALRALVNAGVPAEEIKWLGLDDLLASKSKVTGQEILDHLRDNDIRVQEIQKGESSPKRAALNARIAENAVKLDQLRARLPRVSQDSATYTQLMGDIRTLQGESDRLAAQRDMNASAQYERYTLPGGTNYREVLFQLPTEAPNLNRARPWEDTFRAAKTPDAFYGGHFDEPNILAHVRLKDRIGPDGKKVLFVEEVQSDWHEQGEQGGYRDRNHAAQLENLDKQIADADKLGHTNLKNATTVVSKHYPNLRGIVGPEGIVTLETLKEFHRQAIQDYTNAPLNVPATNPKFHSLVEENFARQNEIGAALGHVEGANKLADGLRQTRSNLLYRAVPNAPFKSNWHELAMKRVLQMAAEEGYDRVAWTTGQHQIDRYPGLQSGQRLKMLYDSHIPNFVDRFGKKFGARVQDFEVNGGEFSPYEKEYNKILPGAVLPQTFRVKGIDLTPSMREGVLGTNRYFWGPGAKAAGTSEAGSAISALTRSLKANKSSFTDPRPIGERLAASAAVSIDTFKKNVYERWGKVADISKAVYDKFTTRAPITDFRQGVKYWQGQIQKSNWEGDQFVRAMKKAHPDVTRREAMSIYAEADGDMGKLKTWAEGMSDKPTVQRKYKDAMSLTAEEKLMATNARLYWDEKLDSAIKLGFFKKGIEDYVFHVVKPKLMGLTEGPNVATLNRLRAELFVGKLQENPSFAKKRFYETIFDLEKSGHVVNADLGYLLAAYDKSFNTAAVSRTFIKGLHGGDASDGRPLVEVSGYGRPMEFKNEQGEVTGVGSVIRPRAKTLTQEGKNLRAAATRLARKDRMGDYPEAGAAADIAQMRADARELNTGDYVRIVHPALQDWKWATNDPSGNPIYLQGELLVHPEIAGKLENLLGRSRIRNAGFEVNGVKYRPLNAVLGAGQAFKETMLDLSGFHAVQVSLHGLEHTVNLAALKDINLEDPHQMRLVENGLVIADHDALAQMSEIGGPKSLVRKIPGASRVAQFTSDFTFHTLIPKLKMTMAIDAFERNKARYPELTEDQLYELTGEQANAAFGGLNYKLLYRNPTAQDMFRMLALAPDFLEARARFVAQAVKPFGREQARALTIGAVTLYTLARFANQAVSGDPHYDKPFSLVVPQPDGSSKEWRLRTIQGDMEHLIRDPQNFTFVRLNPIVARPMVEALMGRDQFGRKQGLGPLATDTLKHGIPVAFQNWIRNPQDYSLLDSLLQSMGVSNNVYRSPAERMADDLSNTPPRALTGAQLAQWQLEHKLTRGLASGEIDKARVVEEFKQGRLSPHAFDKLMDPEINKTRLQRMFTSLNTEDALAVWDVANDKERTQLLPQLLNKWDTVDEKYSPSEAPRIHEMMKAALAKAPKQTAK